MPSRGSGSCSSSSRSPRSAAAGSARPRRRPHDAAARPPPDARRRAHRQHRQPARAHRRAALGRARTARPGVQHDARRPDALGHRADGSSSRTPRTSSGPRSRPPGPTSTSSGSTETSRARNGDRLLEEATTELEELTLLVDELVAARTRRRRRSREGTRPARLPRRGGRRHRGPPLADLVPDRARAVDRRGGTLGTRPGDLQPDRQRGQVEPAGASPSRSPCTTGTVTVRDHGPGIDADDLPHIFDRFYRAAAARTLPGSGLGLAIVRQVAEAHGGAVTAEPAAGGGTRFTLSLPSTPDAGEAEKKARARNTAFA